LHSLDPLRMVFALCVVTLHMDWRLLPLGYLSVEFFFILSGFLIAGTRPTPPEELGRRFLGDLQRLYPLYLFAVLLTLPVSSGSEFGLRDYVFAATMTQSLGLNDAVINLPLWFLTCWFWAVQALRLLRSYLSPQLFTAICASLVLVGYVSIFGTTPSSGLNFSHEEYVGPFTIGLIRALTGIALGFCTHAAFREVSRAKLSWRTSSILELALAGLIIYVFAASARSDFDFAFAFIAVAFLAVFAAENGVLSRAMARVGSLGGERGQTLWRSGSLYVFLFHFPIILAWRRFVPGEPSRFQLVTMWFSTVSLSLIIGSLLNRAVHVAFAARRSPLARPQPDKCAAHSDEVSGILNNHPILRIDLAEMGIQGPSPSTASELVQRCGDSLPAK
jgi:peptidoglycan/LPS O-acetylase OafA/YrhL